MKYKRAMKKAVTIFISIMLSGCFFIGCKSVTCLTGSGKITTEKRSLASFTKVETDAPIDVYLTQGIQQDIDIVASDNLQSHITSIVDDGILKISLDRQLCDTNRIVVYITTDVYEGLKISGAAQVISKNKIDAGNFALDVGGSASVELTMHADRLNVTSCCSANITLSGDAKELLVNASGSGVFTMGNLSVQKCSIEASGSCSLTVNVLKELSVNASGSCVITYKGNPEIINNQLSGSSMVNKIN